jgi:hypothetical protein
LIGTPSFSQRSTVSALVMPSSFANSCTRMFFATAQVSLSLSSTLSHGPRHRGNRRPRTLSRHHLTYLHPDQVRERHLVDPDPLSPALPCAMPDQNHVSTLRHPNIPAHRAMRLDPERKGQSLPAHPPQSRSDTTRDAPAQRGTRRKSAGVGAGQSSSPAPPSAVIESESSDSVTTSSTAGTSPAC